MGKILKFKGVTVEFPDEQKTTSPQPLTEEEALACDIAKSIRKTYTDEQLRQIERELGGGDED